MGYVVDSATETGWVTKYRNLIHFSVVTSAKDEYTTVRNLTFHRHIASVSLAAHTLSYTVLTTTVRTSGWPAADGLPTR